MFVIVLMGRFSQLAANVLQGLVFKAVDAFRKMRSILANREQVRELAQMSDHALHDIGLDRSEVNGALAGGLFTDPSRSLCARHADRQALVVLHQRSQDQGVAISAVSSGDAIPDTALPARC